MKRRIVATIMVALMVVSICSVFPSSTATQEDIFPSGLVKFAELAGTGPASRDGSRAFNDTEHMGRANTPPTIDGLISDGEWDDAAVYDIGISGKKVTYMVMFDSSHIYSAVLAIDDTTNDMTDPPENYITGTDFDYIVLDFDGEDDGVITYTDNDLTDSNPGENPPTWFIPGNCVDRWATASGGSNRAAGWLNLEPGGGIQAWTVTAVGPNQGAQEPYDYINSGFDTYRMYEHSIPFSGGGDELLLSEGDNVGINVIVHDYNDGNGDRIIGKLPGTAVALRSPFVSFMLNGKPKADIASLTENLFYSDEEIAFDGTASSDPEGDSLSYTWDFEYDGETLNSMSTSSSPSHTYNTIGVHTVALRVEDDDGATDIKTLVIETVEPEVPPTFSNVLPNSDPTVEEGEEVTFSADYDDANLDLDAESLQVRWYIDEVLVKTENVTDAGSTSYKIQTNFIDDFDEGSYSVRLAVNDTYDANGKYTGGSKEVSVSWNLTVTNLNRAPVIDTYDPGVLSGESTDEETPMTFAITKSDPDGDTMLVNWFIDDKVQMGAVQNTFVYLPTPDYTAAGPHNIKVVVKDNGQPQIESSITWAIYVNNVNRAPGIKTASPSGKSVKLSEGESQEFKVTAEDPDLETLEYIWTLDGDSVDGADGTSYTFETDFDTATGDDMTLKVEVVDILGASTFKEWSIMVNDVDRLPNIIVISPEEGELYTLSQLITYDATPSLDLDNDKLDFEWEFGDGSSKSAPRTNHRYDEPGEYVVLLTVTSTHDGTPIETTYTVNITIQAAEIEVIEVTTDKLKVTQGDTMVISTQVKNSGDIGADGVELKLYLDGTTPVATLTDKDIAVGEVGEFEFEWVTDRTGEHAFSVILTGNDDTIIIENSLSSDPVKVEPKPSGGLTPGAGGGSMIMLLALLAVIIVVVLIVAIAVSSKKKKRRMAEEQARIDEEERKRQEAEAAAAQAAMYAAPAPDPYAQQYGQQYAQPEAQPLPPPPPPPPPPAASPFVSRRARRQERKEAAEPKIVTPEMAKVAAEAGVCPGCGDEIEPEWTRCVFCGTKLQMTEDEPKEKAPAPLPPPPPPKPKAEPPKAVAAPPPPAPKAGPSCPKCGEEVEPDWAKCPACAHQLKAPPSAVEAAGPKCPKCGDEVEEEWLRCPSCSHQLKDAPKEDASSDNKCPKCGEDVEPEWAKCPFCSKKLK